MPTLTFNTYQKRVAEQQNDANTKTFCVLGMSAVSGEISEQYKQYLGGETFYSEDLVERLGEMLWFVAMTAHIYELDLEQIARYGLASAAQERRLTEITGS